MTVVVFTGPTLPQDQARALLGGTVLPPARQGDIWRAVRAHHPVAIGLIDGVFFHQPAVWHREILWALAQGVHVFGAASMGALRAAELAPFGMRGVGRVFEAFRDGIWPGFSEVFEDDDEVAVVHAPAELGHAPLSDAMVDLRDTLLAACADGVITFSEALDLAERLKALPFAERSLSQIAAIAPDCVASSSAAALGAWVPKGAVPRKRLDAIALLERLGEFLDTRPAPFEAPFRFEHVQAWHDFVTTPDPLTDEEALVLEEARLSPEEWHDTARAALGRLCAIGAAPASSVRDTTLALDQFRLRHGLIRHAHLDAWRVHNSTTTERLTRMMQDEAAVTALLAQPPPGLDASILDHLRLTDRFAELLSRAQVKRAALAGFRPAEPGPSLDAALAWHADRSGGDRLASAPWACTDDGSFQRAIWREYIFVQTGTR